MVTKHTDPGMLQLKSLEARQLILSLLLLCGILLSNAESRADGKAGTRLVEDCWRASYAGATP